MNIDQPSTPSPHSAGSMLAGEHPLPPHLHAPAPRRGSVARRLAAAETPILGDQPALPPGLRSLR